MATPEGISAPIVVDLGKARRRRIRQLKKGTGPLASEVMDVVAQVKAELGQEAASREFVPVVVVYRRKPRRRGGIFPFF